MLIKWNSPMSMVTKLESLTLNLKLGAGSKVLQLRTSYLKSRFQNLPNLTKCLVLSLGGYRALG